MRMCLVLLATMIGAVHGGEAVPPPSVIVRDGKFLLRESGRPFRPVGFNYIRLFNDARTADHDNFSRTGYNAQEHDAMLRRLADGGFNTVRVFIGEDWLPALNRDWAGWLYWTYDTDEQPRLWNVGHDDFAIFRILDDGVRRVPVTSAQE